MTDTDDGGTGPEVSNESTDSDPIRVLVVDDEPDWGTLVVRMLGTVAPEMDVEFESSPRAVVDRVESSASPVDCVVSDYHMPELDGLELLREIRERRPSFPFVLVTGMGSEGVASEAISAGVDDYVVKEYSDDNAATLAARIRNAVEKYRSARALAESESRYRTLVESVRDAIFVVDEGRVTLVNESASRVTGVARDELHGRSLESLVIPTDRAAVRDALSTGPDSPSHESLTVGVPRADGETRQCLLDTDVTVANGREVNVCAMRDVTDIVDQQRRLKRERDTKEAIREMLVRHTSRSSAAEAFCEYVGTDERTVLAWVGEGTRDGGFVLLAAAGDHEYLDAAGILDPAAGTTETTEPSLFASRTGERVVARPSTGDDWHAAAAAADVESAAGFPLEHGGVEYGVFGVYSSDPDAFLGPDAERLTELAESLAYALSTAENREALLADETTRLRLDVTDDGGGLFALERRLDAGVRLTVDAVFPREAGDRHLFECEGAAVSAVRAAVDDVDGVTVHYLSVHGDVVRGRLDVTGDTLAGAVADAGGLLVRLTLDEGGITAEVDLPARRSSSSFAAALGTRFDRVSVTANYRVTDGERPDGLASLTDRQREALQAAYHAGYFQRPKEASAADVADLLGVSRSTFTQHLRAAQRKAFAHLLGDRS